MDSDLYPPERIEQWKRQIHDHNRVFETDIALPVHVIIEKDASRNSSVMVTLQAPGPYLSEPIQMTKKVEDGMEIARDHNRTPRKYQSSARTTYNSRGLFRGRGHLTPTQQTDVSVTICLVA